mgnify:FL=1
MQLGKYRGDAVQVMGYTDGSLAVHICLNRYLVGYNTINRSSPSPILGFHAPRRTDKPTHTAMKKIWLYEHHRASD